MFSMPGPVSAIVATLWLALVAYVLVVMVRAAVLAWKDTHAPAPDTMRWRLQEGRSTRAAA